MPNLPPIVRGPARFGRRATAGDTGGFEAVANAEAGAGISELADAMQLVFEANQQSKMARLEAEGRGAVGDLAAELEQDHDFETHAERFEEGFRGIQGKLEGQLTPGRFRDEFSTRMKLVGEIGRSQVRVGALKRSHGQIEANLNEAERLLVKEYARALGPDARAEVRGRYADAVQKAVRGGALTATQADARNARFGKAGGTARVIQGLREDPTGLLAQLKDPESDLSESLTAQERQEATTRAKKAIEERERAAEARVKEQEARDAKELVALKKKTAQDGWMRVFHGQMNIDWLEENRHLLSESSYSSMMAQAMAGGGELPSGLPVPEELERLRKLEIADPVAFSKETADPKKLGSQYPQMVKDIEAAKDPKVKGAENWKAALLRRTEELKFDKDPDPRVGRFLAAANRLRAAFVAGHGKEPTAVEEDEIINTLSRDFKKARNWRGDIHRTLSEIVPGEDHELVKGIPDAELPGLTESLIALGEEVTDEALLDLYRARNP